MKIGKAIIAVSLSIVTLLGVVSCGGGVSPQQYEALSSELSATKSELNAAKSELASLRAQMSGPSEAQTRYEELNKKYAELQKQYDAKAAEIAAVQAQLNESGAKYTELKKQYDAAITGTAVINEKDIEQAIFNLINRERANSGVPALNWGENLYGWARNNNQTMRANARMENPEYVSWHEVLWAAGYSSAEAIARGAMANWKVNVYTYEKNVLHKSALYGAVNALKSGDVFFITYMADIFK
ncbi:MAG: CAP domain-containing protein [Chloroflexota bacterium]|nr:CAP domain-containing protein [Chloroflexota bacterium]